jgi:hypothetical protein
VADEAAFIRAILASPQDQSPWHIFRDWLEENGLFTWDHLLGLVVQHPDSGSVRLLAALWLDLNGQGEWGGLIRSQCAGRPYRAGGPRDDRIRLARLVLGPTLCSLLDSAAHVFGVARNLAVIGSRGPVWEVRAVDAYGNQLPYPWFVISRGFVHAATLPADDWLRHGDTILDAHPLQEVTFSTWPQLDAMEGGSVGALAIYDGDQGAMRLRWPPVKT